VSTLEQLEKLRSILNDQKRDLTALTNSVRTLSETISENRKEIEQLEKEIIEMQKDTEAKEEISAGKLKEEIKNNEIQN